MGHARDARPNVQPGESVLVIAGSGRRRFRRDPDRARSRLPRVGDGGQRDKDAASRASSERMKSSIIPSPIGRTMCASSAAAAAVDVVIEHVGPATWEGSMKVLARNGRIVTCGATTGPMVQIALPHLFIKNQSVLGSTMGPRNAPADDSESRCERHLSASWSIE